MDYLQDDEEQEEEDIASHKLEAIEMERNRSGSYQENVPSTNDNYYS